MPERKETVHEFFAVTQWQGDGDIPPGISVYHISDERIDGVPLVRKIALVGQSGLAVGGVLKNGSHVGISSIGGQIIVYFPSRNNVRESWHSPDFTNTRYWGGTTTPVVALFFQEEQALACLEELKNGATPEKWNKTTREVIGAIGFNHPVFIIDPGLLARF